MTTKHTPGPWTTNGYSIGIPAGTIAQMYRPGDQSGRGIIQSEQEANARLIAAAPDYYAAAEAIRAHLVTSEPADDGSPNQVPRELLRDLLDAHRKADPTGYGSKK